MLSYFIHVQYKKEYTMKTNHQIRLIISRYYRHKNYKELGERKQFYQSFTISDSDRGMTYCNVGVCNNHRDSHLELVGLAFYFKKTTTLI